MPYKSEEAILEGTQYDARVKLTETDKDRIRELRKKDPRKWTQRELAREFNVSRRLIQFILDPEKKKKNIKRRKERGGWKQYYNKETHGEYMRKHRRRKNKLYKEGKIEIK